MSHIKHDVDLICKIEPEHIVLKIVGNDVHKSISLRLLNSYTYICKNFRGLYNNLNIIR